jgi:hypothetical protein
MTSMPDRAASKTRSRVFIAVEVSKRDWLIAGHTPCDGRTARTSVAAVMSGRSRV